MATFEVYEDSENVTARELKPSRVKTKSSLIPRSVLGDIDNNKIHNLKNQPTKVFQSKVDVSKENDFSDALKLVKLDSKDDTKKSVHQRLPLEDRVLTNDCPSDVSLDFSPSDIDPRQMLLSKIKANNDRMFDCVHYRDDIYAYLRELECKFKPKPFYMRRQPDITDTMRSILVDWLVDVAEEYNLQPETLFMSIGFIDRFLSLMSVTRTKLQLLGASAMFVAAKYEEIYPPSVRDFTYITDNTYTKKQILRMEALLLKSLNFEVSGPTHYTFITHLSKVADLDEKVSILARYLCELTLLEGKHYLQYTPSLVACAAIALARHCLHYADPWSQELVKASGYTLQNHLYVVLQHLNETHLTTPELADKVIKNKYSSSRYFGVALIPHKSLIFRKL